MNTIIFIIYLTFMLNLDASIMRSYKHDLRNTGLKFIIFREKKIPRLLDKLKLFYNICHEKVIAQIGEGICDYNANLTEEQRLIIETIISLSY